MKIDLPIFSLRACVAGLAATLSLAAWAEAGGWLAGRVVDDATGMPVAARVYLTDKRGQPHLIPSRGERPTASYDKTDGPTGIREAYSLPPAEPVRVELPAGTYEVVIERGKEYLPLREKLTLADGETLEREFRLRRFCDMAGLGWYSGDCHVHTPLRDLPAAQLADDVNVAFPITAWTTQLERAPALTAEEKDVVPGRRVDIDATHVYWTLNSEYEITQAGGRDCTLGSMLILGHRQPLTQTAPPLAALEREARRQNAILDWEKHTWPWSTMLVPAAGIDTIELSNNSMWRQRLVTTYLWGRQPPPWIPTPLDARGFIDYGFETYYALLNSGFVLRPSAGTANGVHPVPVGHSRVYVYVEGGFSYEKWVEGLREGRSFSTNGPLLLLTVDGLLPGARRELRGGASTAVEAVVEAYSASPLASVELVVNGRPIRLTSEHTAAPARPHHARYRVPVTLSGSSWVAARCFEEAPADNPRFAHTGVVFFDDRDRPLHPEPRQIQYLVDATAEQIERNRQHLGEPALAEFSQALEVYRRVAAGPPGRLRAETVLRLEPSGKNPRNSEGGFIRLADGRILYIYTHFTGGAGDDDRAHLASRVSHDGGRTWSREDGAVVRDDAGLNAMSVSLLRLADGRIGLFYLLKQSPADCRPVLRISTDEAKTWGPPRMIIADSDVGYYVVNNDRVVQLRSGRLVVPAALHRRSGGRFDPNGLIACYLSDDAGATWRRSRTQFRGPGTLQEPGVVELSGGRLAMFCRSELGSQYLSESKDGGDMWTEPRPSSLVSPQSPASIERIPSTGDLLCVWNRNFEPGRPGAGRRTPLCLALSRDEGQTWEREQIIEDDPHRWYCYTAIEFTGQDVLLAYCAGDRRENNGLALTKLVRVPISSLYRVARCD